MSRDFEELLGCLNGRAAKYLIVGAYAVAFHAKPRYTKDLDLLVEPSVENGRRLIQALADFGFGGLDLSERDFSAPDRIIQLGVAPNRVDLITSLSGLTFEEAWNGRVPSRFGSQPVHYLGKPELIRAKRAAGRPQDLMDLDWLAG